MNISVPIYYHKEGSFYIWTTLGLGTHTLQRRGQSTFSLQQSMGDALRNKMEGLHPKEFEWLQMSLGIRLEQRRLELTLHRKKGKRKFSGLFPLILEPRWFTEHKRFYLVYHPEDQKNWFALENEANLETQATILYQSAWANLSEEKLVSRRLLSSKVKSGLRILSINVQPKTLLDFLPTKEKTVWDDLQDASKPREKRGGYRILPKIGLNLSPRAAEDMLPKGVPRSPYREQLQVLLCGKKKESSLLLGQSGAGKTTIRNHWVWDLLCADGYEAHRNLDRVHDVWLISGKRLIAGMSRIGDWEKRCIDLIEDAQRRKVILVIEDIHLFGQLGRSRESTRNFADFFRGPVARRELTLVGECTHEELQQLEEDAPSFAALFQMLPIVPSTVGETLRIMVSEKRKLEREHFVNCNPFALRAILELGTPLFPGKVLPGKGLDILRQLAKQREGTSLFHLDITTEHVLEYLSERTGLPEILLSFDEKLEEQTLEDLLQRQIIGQKEAVFAACDLIFRIKTGLVDPKRPYGVYLFTGPTGTGKTELAKCIAQYLYGSHTRFLRFDMGEYSSWDAPARLIGSRFHPEGTLTKQVKEQPFCVILFDEIEKAHPAVLHLLLQLFDDGRLTDATGTSVSFTSSVVIMTSNLGAKSRSTAGFSESTEDLMQDIANAVEKFFPPELFNRIDRVIPFWPLRPDTAAFIVEKELGKIFARRGLQERNIFVQCNDAIYQKIVKEAFHSKDGARSLKRYLEQKIVDILSEEISKGFQGNVHLLRFFVQNDEFCLYRESLQEQEPIQNPLALEAMLALPFAKLKEQLPESLAFVRSLEQGDTLQNLSREIQEHLAQHNLGHRDHDETLYNLDAMRQEITEFSEMIEQLLRTEEEEDFELTELIYDASQVPPENLQTRKRKKRLFDRRSLGPTNASLLAKDKILHALAEAHFLQRALQNVHDETQHAIFIELVQIGALKAPLREEVGRLLEWLALFYADQKGEIEQMAFLQKDEIIESNKSEELSYFLKKSPEQIVLKILGLGVFDLFQYETGCHIWQSLARAPEIVRVRVLPAPPSSKTRQIIEEYQKTKKRFETNLEQGNPQGIQNPQGLLPAVRKIRFDPPKKSGQTSSLELEDYTLGYSLNAKARSLHEAFQRLWFLRMSRQETSDEKN